MSYILELSKLELGDIILESGSTKFSEVIKASTKSNYSHAMLYVGHSIIHALTDGVYSKNPQRILTDSEDGLKVLRLKHLLTDKSSRIITEFARNLSGSLYSIPEAGASKVFNNLDKDARTSDQFCSRLVAQSYIQAGISLVTNPNYCSPADIDNSSLLTEIKDCVRVATQEEINFSKTDDPIKENQRRTFEWLNKARKTFKTKGITIQTINDVAIALQNHPELDNEISQFVKDSGYLEHYDYDKCENPYRYNLKLFIEKFEYLGVDGSTFFYGELNKESGEIVRHSSSYFQSGFYFVYFDSEYHQLHVQLYMNLLSLIRDRLSVLQEFSNLANSPKTEEICKYQIRYIDKIISM